jgi:2-polyprenyl-3-methyl-5-hydroxy-6-metoxy-1,4-benzoquinol methylase
MKRRAGARLADLRLLSIATRRGWQSPEHKERMEQTVTTQDIDQAKAEAFGGQMVGILNSAALAWMCSVGYRAGLFETMAKLPPSTSEEIAKAADLNERYVREWLGGVTTGGIVVLDATTDKYSLPPEHAMSLTAAAGPGNLAVMTQFVSQFGNVEDEIVESFRKGGGVPYSRFPTFQRLMAELSAQVFDATLVPVVLELVLGIKDRLREGIDVADVGCGSGHAINLLAKEYPNSRFTGYDFSDEGIVAGTKEAQSLGLSNARFEVKDVATLDGAKKFDLILVFDAIHDQAKPRQVLKGIHDSLKDGGVFLCSDIHANSSVADNIGHPMAPMMYMVSTFHCMTVSLALGGEGLGTMWGEQKARELFNEAGFNDVDIRYVEGDMMNSYYVARP